MNHPGKRWLVGLVLGAAVVETIGMVGWMSWRGLVRRLDSNPAAAAEELESGLLVSLPSAVSRSRRFRVRALTQAPVETAAAGLRALGRRQIDWFPANARGWTNLARAELLLGHADVGTRALEAAVLRDPTSPVLHRLAGFTARALGDQAAALDHFGEALALGSEGWLRTAELTPEELRSILIEGRRRRIERYPRQRSTGVIALAKELRRQDRREEGRDVLQQETADPKVVLELARWDLDDNRPTDAARRLDELRGRRMLTTKILARAWTLTAEAKDLMGDPAGAEQAAGAALSKDPRSPGPYLVLAKLAQARGDDESALAQLRKAWGMNPTDVGLLLAVAATAERAGEEDDARLALERAVSVAPNDVQPRVKLAEFLLRQKDYMAATVTLSEALDRFPTDARLLQLAERLRTEVSRR